MNNDTSDVQQPWIKDPTVLFNFKSNTIAQIGFAFTLTGFALKKNELLIFGIVLILFSLFISFRLMNRTSVENYSANPGSLSDKMGTFDDNGSFWSMKQGPDNQQRGTRTDLLNSYRPNSRLMTDPPHLTTQNPLVNRVYQTGPRLQVGSGNPKMSQPPVIAPSSASDAWRARWSVPSAINARNVHFMPDDYSGWEDDRSFGDTGVIPNRQPQRVMSYDHNGRAVSLIPGYSNKSADSRDSPAAQKFAGQFATVDTYDADNRPPNTNPVEERYSSGLDRIYEASGANAESSDYDYSGFDPSGHSSYTPQKDHTLPSTLSVEDPDIRFRLSDEITHRVDNSPGQTFMEHVGLVDVNSKAMGLSITPEYSYTDNIVGPSNLQHHTHYSVNPQLVRYQGPRNRLEEDPQRNRWTEKQSPYEAVSTSYDPSSIYDPRFNGYGPNSRYYWDTDAGRIKYYYRNVDAMRNPELFLNLSKNNIDHTDYMTPMGAVWQRHHRNSNYEQDLPDYRAAGMDQWMADSTFHREDIMSRLSSVRKENRRNWNLRLAPKQNNTR